jgi:apolipoprotein N-acyltransferase
VKLTTPRLAREKQSIGSTRASDGIRVNNASPFEMGRFANDMAARAILLTAAVITVVVISGDLSLWDVLVLAAIPLIVRGLARTVASLAFVLLWLTAFCLPTMPTYWLCAAPLAWMWRSPPAAYSSPRCIAEAVAVGTAACWLATNFTRESLSGWAAVLHLLGSILFGMQLALVALTIWLLRRRRIIFVAPVAAGVATLAELLQARCGSATVWSMTSLALPAASSAIAQWAYYLTPIGVSGLLYFCNFLCMPDLTMHGARRWISTLCAPLCMGLLCFGGAFIAAHASCVPLDFSAMVVQPHWREEEVSQPDRWTVLDRLTQSDLKGRGPVDLVIWPEAALAPSTVDEAKVSQPDAPLDVRGLTEKIRKEYHTSALVGVMLWKVGTELKYGLPVSQRRAYNCAALIQTSGAICVQEKMALLPVREWLPVWLDQPFVRDRLLPMMGFNPVLSPGSEVRLLRFVQTTGQIKSVVVAICYESHLPWLPHYQKSREADAIIHLAYDGDFAASTDYENRQIWACQYRAIETRKWNLLCTYWSGSALINPKGLVVARLGSVPGTLRTVE